MLETTYEKTKKWGPGSCFILFYLLSISLVTFLFLYKLYYSRDFVGILQNYTIQEDLNTFISSLFFAPWFETLLYNVFLTFIFCYFKCRPTNIIFAVALIFSISHYQTEFFLRYCFFYLLYLFLGITLFITKRSIIYGDF